MNRRNFVAGSMSAGLLTGSAVGWMRAATAPQHAPIVGLLDSAWDYRLLPDVHRGLEENGLVEGKHEHSGWRGEYQADHLADYAAVPRVFSGATSRPTCLSGRSPGRSWFSTARLQDRSEFKFLRRFSPVPTR
jgi:hypothetical protein